MDCTVLDRYGLIASVMSSHRVASLFYLFYSNVLRGGGGPVAGEEREREIEVPTILLTIGLLAVPSS